MVRNRNRCNAFINGTTRRGGLSSGGIAYLRLSPNPLGPLPSDCFVSSRAGWARKRTVTMRLLSEESGLGQMTDRGRSPSAHRADSIHVAVRHRRGGLLLLPPGRD